MVSYKFQQAVSELLLDLTAAQEVGFLCSSLQSQPADTSAAWFGENPVVASLPCWSAGDSYSSRALTLSFASLPIFTFLLTSALPVLKGLQGKTAALLRTSEK